MDRFASLHALADAAASDGEAVSGLLGRFTIRYDKSIEDEQEKEFVFNTLSRLGAKILPQLQKFGPELIIISAGFDAHYRDPLASLNLKAEDFGWVTKKLMDVAESSAEGRIVSVLEGGYDLQGLKESVAAHVTALMNG